MAKSKKSSKEQTDSKASPSFEEALSELQQIADELEDGSLGLEASMKRFEQGMAVLKNCYQILEQAEEKIEMLTGFDAQGNPLTTEFDASATAGNSGKSAGRRKRSNPPAQTENASETEQDEDDEDTLF